MTAFQKIIKYFAIAFAAIIIVSIITAIVTVGSTITGIFLGKDNTTIIDSQVINENISNLDIELKYAKLEIKESTEFKVDITSKDINVSTKDNTLIIKDTSNKRFINTKREQVILYIPEDIIFDNIKISNGTGNLTISKLITTKADLNLGVGSTTIDYIKADSIIIDTGTGSFRINDGELNDSKISIGVGSLHIKGILTGNNDIDCGIGSTTIELKDTKDNYKFLFSKGIGSIKLNGEAIKNDSTIGDGETIIKIDGGIGSISVKAN